MGKGGRRMLYDKGLIQTAIYLSFRIHQTSQIYMPLKNLHIATEHAHVIESEPFAQEAKSRETLQMQNVNP